MIEVRTATIDDAEALAQVESASFPPAEACSLDNFKKRLSVFADYFLVLPMTFMTMPGCTIPRVPGKVCSD